MKAAAGAGRPSSGGDDGAASAAMTPPPSPSIAASPQWQVSSKKPAGFSPFVAFCFTINYILGTGFLTIPWAFVQGGLALSAALLIVVCIFADIAKDYILEVMARAEAMLDEKMRWAKSTPDGPPLLLYPPLIPGPGGPVSTVGRERNVRGNTQMEGLPLTSSRVDYNSMEIPATSFIRTNSMPRSLPGSLPSSAPGTPNTSHHALHTSGAARRDMQGRILVHMEVPKYIIKNRKFEVNALCRVFLGRTGKNIYMVFLALYIFCTLWAYTSVFASAMARIFPFPLSVLGGWADAESASYVIYALVFGAIVIPMSCLELNEQIAAQVFLTGCRFLMLFLMVSTCTACAEELELREDANTFTSPGDGADAGVPMFRLSGLHKMLPIIVFANIYQHSIPGLSHPVADKKKLRTIFLSTTVFSCLAYTFIGIVLGSAFGNRIEQSSNLNWSSFTGGTGHVDEMTGAMVGVSWWARAISLYIICFPALDVLSAYPLNAITLGNNMLSSYYGRKIHDVEGNRSIRIRFRLLAAIPPIILALFVRELGTITDYAGTTGFVLTFSFPALIYISSRKEAEERNFKTETFYTGYASSYFLASVLFVFGVGMLLFVVALEIWV